MNEKLNNIIEQLSNLTYLEMAELVTILTKKLAIELNDEKSSENPLDN